MTAYCHKSGKLIHTSQHDAARACADLSRRHKGMGKTYRCRHCGHWHFTRRVHDLPARLRTRE